MKLAFRLFLCFMVLASCKDPEPRRPISHSSGSSIKSSIERNRILNEKEYELIQKIISNDSLQEYLISQNGFWYTYNFRMESDSITADFGDILNYTYEVKNLNGQIIYSKEDLGVQNYRMDQEELFAGLREGLKLMNTGETVTFIFPSQKAFGYYGDENKIGTNTPIICTVTLNSINKEDSNENETN